MAFGGKGKKVEAKVDKKVPETEVPKMSPAAEATAAATKAHAGVMTAALRTVVSVHPSELKAVVTVNGKKHKVVYHLKDGAEPMIGLPGAGSVKLVDWLQGKADLKGLGQGPG